MRSRSVVLRGCSVLALSALSVRCDYLKSSVAPTPNPLGASGLEISGPSTIAPGQSAQFTALLRLSDNTLKAPPPEARVTWRSSNSSVLRVDESGLATAAASASEVTLTAEVTLTPGGLRRSGKEVVVVPTGTYRLVGIVTDKDYPTIRLAGARVEITPGPLVTTTNSSGSYRLYGVPAEADLRITRDAYVAVDQRLRLAEHSTQNIQLPSAAPRLSLAGPYTLAIDQNNACSGSKPLNADLRHRRYDAVIVQSGITLNVTLTESGRFRTNSVGLGNRFTGEAGFAGATFALAPLDFYYSFYGPSSYANVVERLSNDTFLVVSGRVEASASGGVLSGQMTGSLQHWDSRFPSGSTIGGCFTPIQFTLTPR